MPARPVPHSAPAASGGPAPERPVPSSVRPAAAPRGLRAAGGLALASLLLAGCGMKGPLYLPEPPPPADEQLALPPDVPLGSNPTPQALP